ncbi:RYamide receptor-like [Pollicipes pollicipes]|uniref:RYamide receptor-like n=1 Tax=Pollicipes pollicipes TaxID=41117 RepID=UPI001884938C|nr:RYamide receptor-like [Pollicipes pollicipes]
MHDCVCASGNISVHEYQSWGCSYYDELPDPAFEVAVWLSYIVIVLLSVVGNSLVCYVVMSSARMRTVTNYLIANMAAGDLLMTVLCVPFTSSSVILLRRWPFGEAMCCLVSFTQAVSVFVSAFSLIAISVDRYRAIIYPLQPRVTRQHARVMILFVWLLSAGTCVPIAVTSRTWVPPYPRYALNQYQVCQEVWHSEGDRQYYSLSVMALQYFLPVLVLMYTYGRIAVEVWGKRSSGLFEQQDPREARLSKTRRKVVVMMVVCVVAYTLAWLPYHVFELTTHHFPVVFSWPNIRILFWAVHAVAMSHCCMNPVIYFAMNDKGRSARDLSRYTVECLNMQRLNGTATRSTCMHSLKYDTNGV